MRSVKVIPALLILLATNLAGCATTALTALAAAGGYFGTVAGVQGATSVGNEMQQVYYLGTFDPQGQLPPSIYRVTVHGQASSLSSMKFASGWVPSEFIDPLNSTETFQDNTTTPVKASSVKVSSDNGHAAPLLTGKRLVLFGPEGFREAPKDYRLVIMMGSKPEVLFRAVDRGRFLQNTQAIWAKSSTDVSAATVQKLLDTEREIGRLSEFLLEAKGTPLP